MELIDPRMEYEKALKAGLREYKSCVAAGESGYVRVLDEEVEQIHTAQQEKIGLVEIPISEIVGTKTAGRQCAFSPGFLPILPLGTEFAGKWMRLCAVHMTDKGIESPIECFEYYGKFYVQEGNKRVSVMRYFGANTISGYVTRILPTNTDTPEYALYQEFLEFYQQTKLYAVQFTQPGSYRRLLTVIGAPTPWTRDQRKAFSASFARFRAALVGEVFLGTLTPADALMIFLRYRPFSAIDELSESELKEQVSQLQPDIRALCNPNPVSVSAEPAEPGREPIFSKFFNSLLGRQLNVAFVHERDPQTSNWTRAHEMGRMHLQEMLSDRIETRAYFYAKPGKEAEDLIERAIADGADVIFTTTPPLVGSTLRMANQYPHIKLLNCSVSMPYPDIRTYYGRIYEGKFITGAIAGAMARDGRIGYVGSYPIFGVPASINAFVLGARMVNPNVEIDLEWSCVRDDYLERFREKGISIISNRDMPIAGQLDIEYGTFWRQTDGQYLSLGSPVWNWGRLYERIVRSILEGGWDEEQSEAGSRAVNYWWGMQSGVIDVVLSEALPEGVRMLAETLRRDLQNGQLEPFARQIRKQDGTLLNPERLSLSMDEILHMDYLCDGVVGTIPQFDEILPMAQKMVRLQGVYRDRLPPESEELP